LQSLKYQVMQTDAQIQQAAPLQRTLARLVILCATAISCNGLTARADSRCTVQKKLDRAKTQTQARATAFVVVHSPLKYGQHAQTSLTSRVAAVRTVPATVRRYHLRRNHQTRQAAAQAAHRNHLRLVHQFQARAKAARTVQVQAQAARNHQHQNQHRGAR